MDHRHEPGPFVDQPEPISATLLEKLDFLVVQDMYARTETAQLAASGLPAAGWGEKEGTFINSERRIGLVKKVAPSAPGEALAGLPHIPARSPMLGLAETYSPVVAPEAVFQDPRRALSWQAMRHNRGSMGTRMLESH